MGCNRFFELQLKNVEETIWAFVVGFGDPDIDRSIDRSVVSDQPLRFVVWRASTCWQFTINLNVCGMRSRGVLVILLTS